MGVVSYFTYIVKNHPSIIRKYNKSLLNVDNLYLDCNSIIYDAYSKMKFDSLTDSVTNSIINAVIKKIEYYIDVISPSKTAIIAFDGVAPVAKLEQQRARRYKSGYQNNISKALFKKQKEDPWNTTAITPGTKFMAELNKKVSTHFSIVTPPLQNIIVSGSNHVGEGEHKLFEFIRENPDYHKESTSVVYGLDADLIMLSINHLPISDKIYLFRETPHFIQSINSELEPNETYLIDIPELAKTITLDMNNNNELTTEQHKNRIYDYIFMCFFLGNDFMPHFPAINIRTGGIDKIIMAYKATLGGTNENLTDGKKIYWKNVRKMIKFLADQEENYLKSEARLRDKKDKSTIFKTETPEDIYKKFDVIPTYERDLEKCINPYKDGWQQRYYKRLFNVEITEERKKQICINYLEGLEWTMKYYTTGCPDWRWCYNYNYPPLLSDLIEYIPYFDKEFIENKPSKPVNELVLLSYVLPQQSLNLLPDKLYKSLLTYHSNWYKTDCEFIWAYCRYFWESHVQLPHIDIDELEDFVIKNK